MKFLSRKHLSRRHFLRGAGATIALPLLDSMIPAASAQNQSTPRSRLACIYIAHGAVMKYWTPSADGTGFEFPQTLKSLEPFRDRLNIISDMTLPFAYGEDSSAGANHSRSSSVWLTNVAPGRLQGGRHIRAGLDTPMSNLLSGMFEKLDIPADTFGDSTAVLTI